MGLAEVAAEPGVAVALRSVSLVLDGQPVLRGVRLDLAAGSHTLLVGANGAGKSQLLKILSGERWPSPGAGARREYRHAGGEPAQLREILPRLQLVSAEQQDRYERYDWNYAVSTIVGTGCRGLNAPLGPLTAAERAHAMACLRSLGLWKLRRRRFLGLSYGERRLVLIARALAARPLLLLLDEIYNGLDTTHRRRLDRVLERLCATALTIVLTAHRAEDARPGFTQAVAIKAGRIRYAGPREQLPAAYAGHVGAARAPAALPAPRSRRASAARPPPLIDLERVWVYRDYRRVLSRLSLRIGAGEHWAILGPNGSGKTTLLMLLHGTLWAADGGVVTRRGHARGDPVEDWQARVRLLGPDGHSDCLGSPTLLDVVLTGFPALRRLGASARPAQRAAALRALRAAGVAHLAARSPRSVSYGQLRLALLARAMVGSPEALLLDEPLTGLDVATRRRMRSALEGLARGGIQLVTAVHHADDLIPSITHTLTLPSGTHRRRTPC